MNTQKLFGRGVLLAVVVGLFAAGSAQAASDSWKADVAGNWNANGSWSGNQTPGSTTLDNSDVATFSFTLTSERIVTVDNPRYIGGISFGNTSAYRYYLQTGLLCLNSGGTIQTLSGNGNHMDTLQSIQISGTSGATASFTAGASSSSSILRIGAVTGSATSGNTTTLTLNGANTGTNTMAGIIGDGSGGGKLAIVKDGGGVWTLSGANTFTGGVTLNNGTLKLENAAALGAAASSVFTIAGGNLDSSTLTLGSYVQHWDGDFTYVGSGNLNLGSGAVTLNGNRQVTVSSNAIAAAGAIGGAFSLTKLGAGRLTLAGANTFSGGIYIKAGTLANLTGVRAINGNDNWGPATSTIYLGDATVGADATLQDNGDGNGLSDSSHPINVVSGAGTRTISYGGSGAGLVNGPITLNNNLTVGNNGTKQFKLGSSVTGTGNLTIASTFNNATWPFELTGAINPVGAITNITTSICPVTISGAIGTNVTAVVQNSTSSGLTLSGTNTCSNILVSLGTLQFGGRSSSNAVVTVTSSGTNDVQASYAIAGLNDDSGVGGIVLNNKNNSTNTLRLVGSGAYSFAGVLRNGTNGVATALALTKSGSGTQTLGGVNTYSGATAVSNGTLVVNGTLAAGSAVTVYTNATLGGSGTIDGPVTVNAGGAIQPSSSGGVNTLTLANSSSPTFGATSTLKIRVPTSSTADKVILSNASAIFACGNLNLVIDITGLSAGATGLTIVDASVHGAGGVSGSFASVQVIGGSGYTPAVHVNTLTGTITLDLTGGVLARKLVFTSPPETNAAGVASGAITVQRQTADGTPVTEDPDISVSLSSDSTGTKTFNPVSPLTIATGSSSATFTYTDTKAGTPTITAASAWLIPGTQQETVTNGPATAMAYTSGNSQSGVPGATLASPFVVTVTDTYGNPAPGVTVDFAIATSPANGATLSSPQSPATGSNGQAADTLTLGTEYGTYTVTATAALSGSPVTFTAVAAVPIVKAGTGTELTNGVSWTGGTVPGADNVARWSTGSLGSSLTLASDTAWHGMEVSNALSSIGITGPGLLTLGPSGIDMSASLVNLSLGNPIALGVSQTWDVKSGRTLTASGIVSGSGSLAKLGAGTLTLSGSNTFSGGIYIKAGTLANLLDVKAINGNGNWGPATSTIYLGDATVGANATLQDNGDGDGFSDSSHPIIVVSGEGTRTISYGGRGAGLVNGSITLENKDLTVGNNGIKQFILGSSVTGAGNLTIASTNPNITWPFQLTGAINPVGAITNIGSGNCPSTISGKIGTNVTDIVQNSINSALVLSGSNAFTGNIYIKAGTLADKLGGNNGDTRNWGPPTATIYLGDATVGADATLATQSNAGYGGPASSINPIIVVGGGGNRTIRVLSGVSAQAWIGGNITLSNNLQFIYDNKTTTGNNLKISGNISGTGNLTFASASTIGNCSISLTGASINPVGAITNSSQGTNNISISGAIGANVTDVVQNSATSTLTLSGTNNAYAGTTTVIQGTLETTKTNSLGVASSVIIASGAQMNLNFSGTNTIQSLKLGNVNMPKGIYGTNAPVGNLIFSGLGKLKVTTGPANGALIIIK